MTSSIHVLTTATLDSTPSLLISAPNSEKILINCGEGCQRAFLEAPGLKLKSVNRICLTHLHPTSLGGLPGLLLTTADAADAAVFGQKQIRLNQDATNTQTENQNTDQKVPCIKTGEIRVFGPSGIQAFVHSLRHFMRRDRFETKVYEGAGVFASNNISRKRKKSGIGPEKTLNFTIQTLPFRHCVRDKVVPICSFIFSTPQLVGKFRPDQAAELGIPKGPLYAQLKQGKSVTFNDSKGNPVTVHSHQVVDPNLPGVSVIVVYCPSKSVLEQLQECEELNALRHPATNRTLDVIVHITPYEVFIEKEYRDWLNSFGSDHLWFDAYENVSKRNGTLPIESPFMAANVGAMMRSMINERIFPPQVNFEDKKINFDLEHRATVAKRGLEYILLPRAKRGIHEPAINSVTFKEAVDFVKKSGCLEKAAELTGKSNMSPNEDSSYEILFTGTGSALPCKHRNVSGICLTIEQKKRILLDCGEGTLGQILRSKREDVFSLLKSIQAIWVSHPHADHHLGILRILSERRDLSSESLLLIACPSLLKFLREYEKIDPTIQGSYFFVDCRAFLQGNVFHGGQETPRHLEMSQVYLSRLGINSIRSLPVTHCRDAYAVIVDIENVGKIAYSGDCRPSMQFADAGADADVLIHEATFEDGMEEEAVLKRHSTVGEALSVARRMRAKTVILTHFSQRYPRIPPLQQISMKEERPIVFAFDFVRLTPKTISVAAKLTNAMRLLYPEESKKQEKQDKEGRMNAKEILSIPGIFAQSELL